MLDYDFSETEITKTPDTDDQHSRHGGRSEVGFWELDWVEGLQAVAGGDRGRWDWITGRLQFRTVLALHAALRSEY